MTSPLCLCSVLSVTQSNLRPSRRMWWWALNFTAPPRTFSQFLQATECKGPKSGALSSETAGSPYGCRAPGPLRQAKQEAFCDLSPNISQFPCFIFFYLLLKETFSHYQAPARHIHWEFFHSFILSHYFFFLLISFAFHLDTWRLRDQLSLFCSIIIGFLKLENM